MNKIEKRTKVNGKELLYMNHMYLHYIASHVTHTAPSLLKHNRYSLLKLSQATLDIHPPHNAHV